MLLALLLFPSCSTMLCQYFHAGVSVAKQKFTLRFVACAPRTPTSVHHKVDSHKRCKLPNGTNKKRFFLILSFETFWSPLWRSEQSCFHHSLALLCVLGAVKWHNPPTSCTEENAMRVLQLSYTVTNLIGDEACVSL